MDLGLILRLFTSFDLRAVDRGMFCYLSIFQLLNPYVLISAVTVLQGVAQLGIACRIFCVLRGKHLSISNSSYISAQNSYRSTCLSIFRLAC